MAEFKNDVFEDAQKARTWLEAHLWPDGPICPHCGNINEATLVQGNKDTKAPHRDGLYMCNACRQQFTVTVGTIFERSHVPLNKWLQAAFLICSSKKGISSHQLHRMLAVTYRTAWFMSMRIREAMREGDFPIPMGGEGKTVEADEAYIGGLEGNRHVGKRRGRSVAGGKGKEATFAMVERGGKVRSTHLPAVNSSNVRRILTEQVREATNIVTDTSPIYRWVGKDFASHATVNHTIDEYVRGDAHTNTIENYFSILKRGIVGTYFHVSPQHLKRYLAEFDFRYNERTALGVEDRERTAKALKGIVGKRVTYRRTNNARA